MLVWQAGHGVVRACHEGSGRGTLLACSLAAQTYDVTQR